MTRISALFRGRRSIGSGSFPLYRVCVLMGLVASITQIVYGVPESVLQTTDHAYGWIFIGLHITGSVLILSALYLPRLDLDDSLRIEQIGALALFSACSTYVAAVVVNNGGPPASYATWLVVALSLYLAYRIIEIHRILKTWLQEVKRASC